jgi:sugar lactone lactonase YvrE
MSRVVVALLAGLLIAPGLSPISPARAEDEDSAADLLGLMYWTHRDEGVYRACRDGSEMKLIHQRKNVDGLAIDEKAGKLYFSVSNTEAANADTLHRMNLDGSGVEDLAVGLNWTGDLVVDPERGKLYVSSLADNKILVANLDGTEPKDFIAGLSSPDEMAFDAKNKKLYWANSGQGGIRRANLDGTQQVDVLPAEHYSFGIALDLDKRQLYYADAANGVIRRIGFDGKGDEQLVSGLNGVDGVAIDAYNRKLYWTEEGKIGQANFDGSERETLVEGKCAKFASLIVLPPKEAP